MDARPLEEFTKGHILGAISLPWHEAEQRVMDVTADMANDAVIITYCDGDTCTLSKELALFLENLLWGLFKIADRHGQGPGGDGSVLS